MPGASATDLSPSCLDHLGTQLVHGRFQRRELIDMKTMIVAAATLAVAMGTAAAQSPGSNGNGPVGPMSPFTIWQMQSQTGKRMIPTAELMRMAHEGRGLNGAPTPRGIAEAPAQTPVDPD
jgi:hypothetical protein